MSPEIQGAIVGGVIGFLSAFITQLSGNRHSSRLQKEQLENQNKENQKQINYNLYNQRSLIYKEINENFTELQSTILNVKAINRDKTHKAIDNSYKKIITMSIMLPLDILERLVKVTQDASKLINSNNLQQKKMLETSISDELVEIAVLFKADLENLKKSFIGQNGEVHS